MGLYYDKRRDKWNARISVGNSRRVYIGAYPTAREALLASLRAQLMYEMLTHTKSEFVPQYIEDDTSIKWLIPFRKAKMKKFADRMEIIILSTAVKRARRQAEQRVPV